MSDSASVAAANATGQTPTSFQIETEDASLPCGVSSKLPPEMCPQAHINYENRLYDADDALPKVSPHSLTRSLAHFTDSLTDSLTHSLTQFLGMPPPYGDGPMCSSDGTPV